MRIADPDAAAKIEVAQWNSVAVKLADVRREMQSLARSRRPTELAEIAFSLYEQFRPIVARGQRGWGQKGTLDLALIQSLAKLD